MPDLAITELSLSHFRSHRTTRLMLDSRPLALFGPNGAGKTNILEAISLLSPGRGLRRASTDDLARRPEAIGWKVAAEVQTSGTTYHVETRCEPGRARTVQIDGKTVTQTALGRIVRVLWLVPAMDRLWTDPAESRRRFLDRMTMSFFPGHAEAVLGYEKAMRERNRLLREQVADNAWFSALEAQMASAGSEIATNRRNALEQLGRALADSTTSFPAATLALSGPDDQPMPETEDAIRGTLGAFRRRDRLAGRTLAGPHRADLRAIYAEKQIEAAQCSTGEQKALLISLVLANARALAATLGEAPILLLDEVAAHLDESRRSALFEELLALDTQAWMTGTDATLFRALGNRAQAFRISESVSGSLAEPFAMSGMIASGPEKGPAGE